MRALLRVLLLSGSLSNSSHARVFLEDPAILVREQSVIAYVWDPHLKPLPILSLVSYSHPRDRESEIVQQLAPSADQADAFVLGTRMEKLLIRMANELVEYSLLMRELRESFP